MCGRFPIEFVVRRIRALPVPEIEALSLTKLHTSGGRRNMWTIKARWYLLKHFVLHVHFSWKFTHIFQNLCIFKYFWRISSEMYI